MKMKNCSKCKILYPLEGFHRDSQTKSGYARQCKVCKQLYYKKHRDKIIAHTYKINKENNRLYTLNRRKIDPSFKLCQRLRSRLHAALRTSQKVGSAVRDLGCTVDELKLYLESKFQPGMSWENWGIKGWHIDHIKPLSSFNLTEREQFLKATHFSNLQPLWASYNYQKGAK